MDRRMSTRTTPRSPADRPAARAHAARLRTAASAAALLVATATNAYAGGPAMVWDTGLSRLTANLQGPTAVVVVTVAIMLCGVTWMFTRHEEGLKWLGRVAVGGAVLLGVTTFITNMGWTTGALM